MESSRGERSKVAMHIYRQVSDQGMSDVQPKLGDWNGMLIPIVSARTDLP